MTAAIYAAIGLLFGSIFAVASFFGIVAARAMGGVELQVRDR